MSLRVFGERAAESSGSALARTARVLVKSSPCLSVSVVFEFPRSSVRIPVRARGGIARDHRVHARGISHRPHTRPIDRLDLRHIVSCRPACPSGRARSPSLCPWFLRGPSSHACLVTYLCACPHACLRTCLHAGLHTCPYKCLLTLSAHMPTCIH